MLRDDIRTYRQIGGFCSEAKTGQNERAYRISWEIFTGDGEYSYLDILPEEWQDIQQ
jgi:hypothetical protein